MSEDESLRDIFRDFGGAELKKAIDDKYYDKLKVETLWGEPVGDFRQVDTFIRKYDHSPANNRTVTEIGVKAVFDPEETEFSNLTEGGEIRRDLRVLAEQHYSCDLQKVDLHDADDEYIVFLVADVEQLVS